MYRLNIFAALMLLCVLTACSGSSGKTQLPAGDGQPSQRVNEQGSEATETRQRGDVLPESETSAPASVTLVGEEFARRMRMPDLSVLEELDFPDESLLGKLPSTAGTDSLNGSQHFKISKPANGEATASNVGTAKRLNSTNSTAWVMYRFQGYDFHKDPGTITVHTAMESFAGADPGYLLAIANYKTGRWEILGTTQIVNPGIRSLVVGHQYRSPLDNIFIAVILPAGQMLDVSQVELSYDEVTWLNVEVDSIAGWTPAVEFLPNGNIFIAYADINVGLPLAAVLDRSLYPADPANWVIGEMNSLGKGVGLGQDVVIGPAGTPRVSLAYTAIGGSGPNTLMGYTAYYDAGAENEAGFWNYEFGPTPDIKELAGSSSTDYNSQAGTYGYAAHFYNYPAGEQAKEGSARYRQFTLNESVPQETISTAGGLTVGGYWFPRVRFAPDDPLLYFANNGGYLTYEPTPNTLNDIYVDDSSHDIGALAINPNAGPADELFGFVYKHFDPDGNVNGAELFRYVPLLENFNLKGGIQQVDEYPAGATDFLADFNQVDFTPDGRPAIAYTKDSANSITIWYAYYDGANWQKEQVSAQAISKYTPSLRVWLDMAIDDNGIAAVVWDSPQDIDDNRLVFAIRGS